MKKWILRSITGFVLCGTQLTGNAFATQARVQALGGGTNSAPAHFYSLEDDRDIFHFPSQVNTHKNTGFVDLYDLSEPAVGAKNASDASDPSAGGIYGFNNGASVGLFVNRDDNGIRTTDFVGTFTATPTPLENPFDLFASLKRGIFTFGASLHIANGKDDSESTSDATTTTITSGTAAAPILGDQTSASSNKKSSLKKLVLGTTVDLGPTPNSYLDVSFGYTSFEALNESRTRTVTFNNASPTAANADFDTTDTFLKEKAESDGIFSLMARAFLPVQGNPTLRFVPAAYIAFQDSRFNSSSTTTVTNTNTAAGTTTQTLPVPGANNPEQPNQLKFQESRYGLGLGLNRTTPNNMVAVNLNIEAWKMKKRREVNTGATGIDNSGPKSSGIPVSIKAALESKIGKPWLIGRVGIKQTLFGRQRSDTRTTAATTPSGTVTTPVFETSVSSTSQTDSNIGDNDPDFISLGFGIIKGNFSLDAVIVESNLFSGTYLLSGNKANLLAAISAKLKLD